MKSSSVCILLDQILNEKCITNEKKMLTVISKLPDLLKEDETLRSYISSWLEKIVAFWKHEKLNTDIIELSSDLFSILIEHELLFIVTNNLLVEFINLYGGFYYENKYDDIMLFLSKYIEQQMVLLKKKQIETITDTGLWKPAVEAIVNECCDRNTFLYTELLAYIAELFSSCEDINVCTEIIKAIDPNKIISDSSSLDMYRLDMIYHLLICDSTDTYSTQICKLIKDYPNIKCLQNHLIDTMENASYKIAVILLTCYYADVTTQYSEHDTPLMLIHPVSNCFKNTVNILKYLLQNGYPKLIHEISHVCILHMLKLPSEDITSYCVNRMFYIMIVPVVTCAVNKVDESNRISNNFRSMDDHHGRLTTDIYRSFIKKILEVVDEFVMQYETFLNGTHLERLLEMINLLDVFVSDRNLLHKIYDENKIYLSKLLSLMLTEIVEYFDGNQCNEFLFILLHIIKNLNCIFNEDAYVACHEESIALLRSTLFLLKRLPPASTSTNKLHMESFTLLCHILRKVPSSTMEVDSKLCSLFSDMLVEKLANSNWEIRDSALECVGNIVITYYGGKESFANTTCFVMNEKIIDSIVATIADNERFVRYTAYCTLTNIVQYTRCRQIPLSSDDLIDKILTAYTTEEEGIVREQMVHLLYQMFANKTFSNDRFLKICELMVYIVKKDLYPVCVQHSLKFWNKIINVILQFCGNLSSKHLQFLSSSGCLQVLIDIVLFEYDEILINSTLCIIRNLLRAIDLNSDDEAIKLVQTDEKESTRQSRKQQQKIRIEDEPSVKYDDIIIEANQVIPSSSEQSRDDDDKRDHIISSILDTDDISLLPAILTDYCASSDNQNEATDLVNSQQKISYPRMSVRNFFTNVYKTKINAMLKELVASSMSEENKEQSFAIGANAETDKELYGFLSELIDNDYYCQKHIIITDKSSPSDYDVDLYKTFSDDIDDELLEKSLGHDAIQTSSNDDENGNSSDSGSEKEFDILDCY